MTIRPATIAILLSIALCLPAQSAPSTSAGQISVAQVIDLIQRSPSDNGARNAAMAYLSGVGEATGLLIASARERASDSIVCSGALGMSSQAALAALSRLDPQSWAETAATPILVDDMLARADCR